jgi:hypothetical protein
MIEWTVSFQNPAVPTEPPDFFVPQGKEKTIRHPALAASTWRQFMRIEGIKGCYEKTDGMFYFARMCSKIRLHAEGRLPEQYFDMLGNGFDGRTCRYLGVSYEDLKSQVLAGKDDSEVLAWCFSTGRRLTAEEILIYNSFMSKRGWRDDETDEFIPQSIKDYGVPDDGRVVTDFDLIEVDEGRWYPDMWRDAWK